MKYETRCIKIKLKPNSIEKVRKWARVINHRKDEALAILQTDAFFGLKPLRLLMRYPERQSREKVNPFCAVF